LFPAHVSRHEIYAECGDGGWAGGGPDDWGASIEFSGRTPAGRLAVSALEADKTLRPAKAMAEAIKQESERLRLAGEAKALAEAKAAADEAAIKIVEKSLRELRMGFDEIFRELSKNTDSSGSSPDWLRSSDCRKKNLEFFRAAKTVIDDYLADNGTDWLTLDRVEELASLDDKLARAEKRFTSAIKNEDILSRLYSGKLTADEIKSAIDSAWFFSKEKSRLNGALADLQSEAEIEEPKNDNFNSGAWDALDKLK
jgi:hypothetical protein